DDGSRRHRRGLGGDPVSGGKRVAGCRIAGVGGRARQRRVRSRGEAVSRDRKAQDIVSAPVAGHQLREIRRESHPTTNPVRPQRQAVSRLLNE
ncbi:MAG: hypothetical protein WAK23_10010, partial [Terriglobales bacterium]